MAREKDASAARFCHDCGVGDIVEGKIVSIAPFGGAFVDIGDGTLGLAHEPEQSGTLEVGTTLRWEIIAVDRNAHRLSLRPA